MSRTSTDTGSVTLAENSEMRDGLEILELEQDDDGGEESNQCHVDVTHVVSLLLLQSVIAP